MTFASINFVSNIAVNSLKQGLSHSSTDPRPYLMINLDGTEIEFMYDTGATVSTISKQVFDRYFNYPRRSKFRKQGGPVIVGAGANPITSTTYFLPVTVNGKSAIHPFNVANNIELCLIGTPFLQAFNLSYDADQQEIFAVNPDSATLTVGATYTWGPYETRVIGARFLGHTQSFTTQIATLGNPDYGSLIGGPAITSVDQNGICQIAVTNSAPFEVTIPKNTPIGTLEQLHNVDPILLDGGHLNDFLHAVSDQSPKSKALSNSEIRQRAHLQVPEEFKERYLQLLIRYKRVISTSKADLGRSKHYSHRIHLKDPQPVYQPQFPLKPDHQQFIEATLEDWLKLGVVRRTRSLYNSPIFCVPKKNGQGLRIVQDFRGLNAKTKTDKYSTKEISECLADIGKANSSIFTTIDLTSGFWQMPIHPDDSPLTAFTVKNRGQFEWITSPMGLLGCPASFQRLMEKVMEGIQHVLVYIDDVIIHTADHETHLRILEDTLQRMDQHGLKINLDKCYFGNKEVAYLGFTLTPQGILPGKDKLKAVQHYPEPTTLKEVRGFVGLCNFFRNHIRNFAIISTPLTALTRTDSGYKGGPLPTMALQAFHRLKNELGTEPCLAFPRTDRTYALVTEAFPPTAKFGGGITGILCQVDKDNQFHVLSYYSRQLQDHETRYPTFLLDMLAAKEGMTQFDQQLRGRHFLLFMDEHPEEELSHLHKKTLARFKAEGMDQYSFTIQKKTAEILPPCLRTASPMKINVISGHNPLVLQDQYQDQDVQVCLHFLKHQNWPLDCSPETQTRLRSMIQRVKTDESGSVWLQFPDQVALFLPARFRKTLTCQIVRSSPSNASPEHLEQTLIKKGYAWPGMRQDLLTHECQHCRRTPDPKQSIMPNHLINMDLLGPMLSYQEDKYLLVVEDSATKITELVPLADKSPATIGTKLTTEWICKYGLPNIISTAFDQETVSLIKDTVLAKLRIEDDPLQILAKQTPEVTESIYGAIADLYQEAELSWTDYLPALTFRYNTSYNSKLKEVPFMALYGRQPRQWLNQKSSMADDFPHLENNRFLKTKSFIKAKTTPPKDPEVNLSNWKVGDQIYFWENSFGGKSWTGPFEIIDVKPAKVKIQLGFAKTRWLWNYRVAFGPGSSKQGEEGVQAINRPLPKRWPQNSIMALAQQPDVTQQLIRFQQDQTQALQILIAQDARAKAINSLANYQAELITQEINALDEEEEHLRDYLGQLAFKIYSSPTSDSTVITPEELSFWNQFSPTDRNIILTGDPYAVPEWRTSLYCPAQDEEATGQPEEDFQEPVPQVEAIPVPTGATQNWLLPEPSGLDWRPLPTSGTKTNSSFKRAASKRMSKTVRGLKSTAGKLLAKLDPNNNPVAKASTSSSMFYRELDPGDLGGF